MQTEDSSSENHDVAAIVLAAGRSQRMGAFKPLLPFGETTVVGSCLRYLREAGVLTIILVVGHRAEELKNRISDSNLIFVTNPDTNGEMSSSIVCGVNELSPETKAILITPADLPAVPSKVVSQLITEWRRGHRLVKPTWQGRGGHPVLIDNSFREELIHLNPTQGLKNLFDRNVDQVRRLPIDSSYIARDIDTWDDYATLHVEVFGQLPPAVPSAAELGAEPQTN